MKAPSAAIELRGAFFFLPTDLRGPGQSAGHPSGGAGIAARGSVAIVLHMSDPHADRLHAALTGLLGRRVTNEEIWTAFGISKARYYQIVREDPSQLLRADRLVEAARQMGANPVELLVCLGIINTRDARDYIDKKRRELSDLLDPDPEASSSDPKPR